MENYDKEIEVIAFSPQNKKPHHLGGAAICVECARKKPIQEKHGLPPESKWGPEEGKPNYIALNSPITCFECGEKCYSSN